MSKISKSRITAFLTVLYLALVAAACAPGGDEESASQAALRTYPTPDGRVVTANQASNTLSLIDVSTNQSYGSINTGEQPHHVVTTADGKTIWVSLYAENRMQVFDAGNLSQVASIDIGSSNDDLAFAPDGKTVYVSLGKDNMVASVDAQTYKLIEKVKVGATPHGVRVTPDGKLLVVTNTADNTVSILTVQPKMQVVATVKTGTDPFEVYISNDSKTAYVSNFLADSLTVVDLTQNKAAGFIRSGKQPAMLILQDTADGQKLWVANTGSTDLWAIDPATRKFMTRVPVGKGAHGVIATPSGKLFITNATDNTVSIVDSATNAVLATVPVGNGPNGLAFLPNITK